MPHSLSEIDIIAKRKLPIIFVIDSSCSLRGLPIALINRMMNFCIESLKTLNSEKIDYDIVLSILEFNQTCNWITGDCLVLPKDFVWENIFAVSVGVISNVAIELSQKMSRKVLFSGGTGYLRPIVVFITDGASSSLDEEIAESIKKLRENMWFHRSIRIAVSIGKISDMQVLNELVGVGGVILEVNELSTDNLDLLTPLLSHLFTNLLEYGSWINFHYFTQELDLLTIYRVVDTPILGVERVQIALRSNNEENESWNEDDW